jgi:two-component system response regulator AtoC
MSMLSGSPSRHSSLGPLEAPTIVGSSPALQRVLHIASRLAAGDSKVLITGESGVGKDVVARHVHVTSPRAAQRFVALNCASVTETLLESELFGHVKGSFTGAYRDKVGKLQQAHKGTIFLDEIGEMSPSLQAKLLQVLQDGEFSRLGGLTEVRVDVRVVAATNCDLERAVAAGAFREDLYFRINVVEITLPPLRERREDIPLLTGHFLKMQQALARRPAVTVLSADTLHLFATYDWPGNVRELENMVKRIIVLGDEQAAHEVIARRQTTVPARPQPEAGVAVAAAAQADGTSRLTSLKDIGRSAAREAERIAILDMLERTRWNRKEAAEILGISYKALLYKIKDNRLDEAS